MGIKVILADDHETLRAGFRGILESADNIEVIADANEKMDRCLRAGALTMGAQVNIVTMPGYLPMVNNPAMMDLFRDNSGQLVGAGSTPQTVTLAMERLQFAVQQHQFDLG